MRAMARYRLYYLQNGTLAGTDEIEAADDVQASRLAKARLRRETVEIWRDGRRVRTLVPLQGELPLSMH